MQRRIREHRVITLKTLCASTHKSDKCYPSCIFGIVVYIDNTVRKDIKLTPRSKPFAGYVLRMLDRGFFLTGENV